jgi:Zn-dependent alcohol dehydrogenase
VIDGKLDLRRLVGETVTLDQLPAAFERARKGSGPVRIVYKAAHA